MRAAFLLFTFTVLSITTYAQNAEPDSNFYIYLAFGQSNMEGGGTVSSEDQVADPRFQVFQAVDCTNLDREKGNWYPATPPLARCYTGPSPADYFGRTMVEHLPDSIRVGIINVSVAGSKIELFQKSVYQDYVDSVTEDWLINIINEYDGNPYQYLVDLALEAKKDGVIKGFIMHQGESNGGDQQWPNKVKSVYDSLIVDLELEADSIPLLAGELVNQDQGGAVAGMNSIINTLPQVIPNSYIISSSRCTVLADKLHFDASGKQKLGTRYAAQMLSLLGIEIELNEETGGPVNTYAAFYEPECAIVGSNWEVVEDAGASNGRYVTSRDGMENVSGATSDTASHIIIPFSIDTAGEYKLLARFNNPTYDDDSFYMRFNEEEFFTINGQVTSGWQWVNLGLYELPEGEHTFTVAFRENGAKLDKIALSNYEQLPEGLGDEAVNICQITNNETGTNIPFDYQLKQNYPNPFNPTTQLSYSLPESAYITLKVFDGLGREIAVLVDAQQASGSHQVTFDATGLSNGVYYYRLKTSKGFTQTKKMTLLK